jgi:hypothetical protein
MEREKIGDQKPSGQLKSHVPEGALWWISASKPRKRSYALCRGIQKELFSRGVSFRNHKFDLQHDLNVRLDEDEDERSD